MKRLSPTDGFGDGFARAGVWIMLSAPVVVALLFVRDFGVNSVFADQWMIVGNLVRISNGNFDLAELWSSHHEHVIAFPRAVMLLLGLITSYDVRFEMYLVVACLAAVMIFYFLVFRRDFAGSALLFVPIALLAMSLRQHGNMLWGFQITLVFALLFSVLAFFFLDALRRDRVRLVFPVAILGGLVATFSSAPGLLVWPLGFAQLLLMRAGRSLVAAWAGVGAVVWAVYFGVLVEGAGGSSPFETLTRPLAAAEFFLTLLGGSVFGDLDLALRAGALLAFLVVVSLVLVLLRGRFGEEGFWISLMFFSLFALAFITAGRQGSGLEQALLSRYATFSIPAVVSVYALLAKAAFNGRSLVAGAVFGVTLLFVATSLPSTFSSGLRGGEHIQANRQSAAIVLSSYEERSADELEAAHGWEGISSRAAALERLGYSVFDDSSEDG